MTRTISDKVKTAFAPTANLKTSKAWLTGTMVGKRAVKTQYGMKNVYSLELIESGCTFTLDGETVEPNSGDNVDVFSTTRLDRQLAQIEPGTTTTIKYLGTRDSGRGNPAHVYTVEIDE